jgi:cell division protein FtsB
LWAQKEMDFKRQLRDRRHVDTGLAKSTKDIQRENKSLRQENKQLKEKVKSLESEIEVITSKYSNVQRLVHSLSRYP